MQDLIEKLEATKGTEEFEAVTEHLESLAAKELNEISKAFYGAPARSKAQALRQIRMRHDSLVDLKARAAATAGRSAA